MVLEVVNPEVPETMGGSADLDRLEQHRTKDLGMLLAGKPQGRYVNYGIREHGMAAAMNGMGCMAASSLWRHLHVTSVDYARRRHPPVGTDGPAGRPMS